MRRFATTLAASRTSDRRTVLLVWHSRTGLAQQMADCLEEGARAAAEEMEAPLRINKKPASDANVSDMLDADGFIFCAPENLASTSGEMLEFFHRNFYHLFADKNGDEISLILGRPYALAVAAGNDGSNAAQQMTRICQGWRLRPVAEPFVHRNGLPQRAADVLSPKVLQPAACMQCKELGGLVAATLLL